MAIELTKEEVADIIPSLRRYFREELELEISEMRARFLLNYFLRRSLRLPTTKASRTPNRIFVEGSKICPAPASSRPDLLAQEKEVKDRARSPDIVLILRTEGRRLAPYRCVTIWGRVLSMMERSSFCSLFGI